MNSNNNEFTHVADDGLSYSHPQKEEYPKRTSNWRNGLQNILSSVESNDNGVSGRNSPIVYYQNEKYVCTYDMVRIEVKMCSCVMYFVLINTHPDCFASVLIDLLLYSVSKSKVSFGINAEKE